MQQAAGLESRSVGDYRLRDGGTITYRHEYTAGVAAADPAGAAIDCRSSVEVQRDSGVIMIRTLSHFTAEQVTVQAEVEQDGAILFTKKWESARGEGST